MDQSDKVVFRPPYSAYGLGDNKEFAKEYAEEVFQTVMSDSYSAKILEIISSAMDNNTGIMDLISLLEKEGFDMTIDIMSNCSGYYGANLTTREVEEFSW